MSSALGTLSLVWPAEVRPEIRFRPLVPADGGHVRQLIEAPLADLYPGSDRWLASKTQMLGTGGLWGVGAFSGETLVGVVLASPKPHGSVKINTLFVAEASRGRGVGATLVAAVAAFVDGTGADECYVTVAHHLADDLKKVLQPAGFTLTATVPGRYGTGRDETVWTRVRPVASSVVGGRVCDSTDRGWVKDPI